MQKLNCLGLGAGRAGQEAVDSCPAYHASNTKGKKRVW